MQRRWFVLPILAVLGGLSGTAIAGLPENGAAPTLLNEPAVESAGGQVLSAQTPAGAIDDAGLAAAATPAATAATTTTWVPLPVAQALPIPSDPATTAASVPASLAVAVDTTVAEEDGPLTPSNEADATDEADTEPIDPADQGLDPGTTDTTVLSTTVPEQEMDDRSAIRVVLVDGDTVGLAQKAGARLIGAGYTQIVVATDVKSVESTTVYFRPGFVREAWMLSGDLFVPGASLQAFPPEGITSVDDSADIVVVVGGDAGL